MHEHNHEHHTHRSPYLPELISLALMAVAYILAHFRLLPGVFEPLLYLVSLLPVGLPVLKEAAEEWRSGDFFNEFTLMLLACAGAFVIGEYPEGVAIILFYSFGEKLEETATEQSKRRIKALLGNLPRAVEVEGRGIVEPEDVRPGEIITVRPGERVGLDGELAGDGAVSFDTSAFSGESLPVEFKSGAEVPAGAIPLDRAVRLRVLRPYAESSMSRIMAMIESAGERKSRSETLLRRITRWYTPAVILAAALVFLIPAAVALIGGEAFAWQVWLERALVLLVCSCPCALVVSVPLSYFAAIGVASSRGILFKSSSALDALRRCDTLYLDKTGTITTGHFRVRKILAADGFTQNEVVSLAAAVDSRSAHPLARAISEEAAGMSLPDVADVRTVAHGMSAELAGGEQVLVGSRRLLADAGIALPEAREGMTEVCVAENGRFVGAIYFADTVKAGAESSLAALRRLGFKKIEILSGDRPEAVAAVASQVEADSYRGGLLPEDKQKIIDEAAGRGERVAFVGDGINDAPSLAAANVGIAIGSGGTDLAMESADAVLTAPDLAPLVSAMRLSRKVKAVVTQNVSLAIGVKLLVMVLGVCGLATLWAAVFADTGITLITVIWTLLALGVTKNR